MPLNNKIKKGEIILFSKIFWHDAIKTSHKAITRVSRTQKSLILTTKTNTFSIKYEKIKLIITFIKIKKRGGKLIEKEEKEVARIFMPLLLKNHNGTDKK